MSTSDAFAALARQAREIADLADRLAIVPAEHLAAADLADIDTLALATRSAAASCRRAVYDALAAAGATNTAIGGMFGVTGAAVGKVRNATPAQLRTIGDAQ